MTTLTIRPATPADAPALTDLARLDSARPLAGHVLVAESAGRPVAAVGLDSGRTVADPFLATAQAVTVLGVRAAQLRVAATADTGRRVRRLRLRPASG